MLLLASQMYTRETDGKAGIWQSGTLSPQDYFQSTNYAKFNSGDQNIPPFGLSLLDSNSVSWIGVKRVGVSDSKAGTVYAVNADNLGGYTVGADNTDANEFLPRTKLLLVPTIPVPQ